MRKFLISLGLATTVVLAAGCGGDDHTSAGSDHEGMASTKAGSDSAGHNDQDIMFAQMMIPHHQQAVDMAVMAEEEAADPKVKDLAARIKSAQDPEIQQMTSMLESWGAPMSTDESMEDMPGMDHGETGHGGMSDGMMSDEEMRKLEKATGAAFDGMWLQMMIKHHQGAVSMSKTELDKGSNADAKALAQRIIGAQQDEIDEMQKVVS